MENEKTIERNKISLERAWSLSKEWNKAAMIWRALDHLFVICAFTASVSVIYITTTLDDAKPLIIILSSVSAILTLVSFACNPTKYMTNYRKAYQELNSAQVKNTDDKGRIIDETEGFLAIKQAIIIGEQYIGRTYDVDIELA